MVNEHINSWKNKNVFLKQLELNKFELNGNYPQHWYAFLKLINSIEEKPLNLLDIGCGVGSFSELTKRHFSEVSYTGIDYSEEAIDLANKTWTNSKFEVKDVNDLNANYLQEFNVIHLGALLDVLPEADVTLKNILDFKVKYVILTRVEFTDKQSHNYSYSAYDEIITYKYLHNVDKFISIVSENYNIIFNVENNFLLKIK